MDLPWNLTGFFLNRIKSWTIDKNFIYGITLSKVRLNEIKNKSKGYVSMLYINKKRLYNKPRDKAKKYLRNFSPFNAQCPKMVKHT